MCHEKKEAKLLRISQYQFTDPIKKNILSHYTQVKSTIKLLLQFF